MVIVFLWLCASACLTPLSFSSSVCNHSVSSSSSLALWSDLNERGYEVAMQDAVRLVTMSIRFEADQELDSPRQWDVMETDRGVRIYLDEKKEKPPLWILKKGDSPQASGYEAMRLPVRGVSLFTETQGSYGTRCPLRDRFELGGRTFNKSEVVLILTGGGDCAGLNTAIAKVAQEAEKRGLYLVGIRNAFTGATAHSRTPPADGSMDQAFRKRLVWVDPSPVNRETLRDRPSSILGSARLHPYKEDKETAAALRRNLSNFAAVVGTGGDDTLSVVMEMGEDPEINVPVIAGIPKSIDNDTSDTQMIGFNAARQKGRELFYLGAVLAELKGKKIFVSEIMGRKAGWLAFAARCDIEDEEFQKEFQKLPRWLQRAIERYRETVLILTPEKPASLEGLVKQAAEIYHRHGRVNIMVAEGFSIGDADPLLQELCELDPALAARWNIPVSRDRYGNKKLGGVSHFITGLLEAKLSEELARLEPEAQPLRADDIMHAVLGFTLRGLIPDDYEQALAELFAERIGDLFRRPLLGPDTKPVPERRGVAVTLADFTDPRDPDARVELIPIERDGILAQKDIIKLFTDEALARAGVFWGSMPAVERVPVSGEALSPQRFAEIREEIPSLPALSQELFLSTAATAETHNRPSVFAVTQAVLEEFRRRSARANIPFIDKSARLGTIYIGVDYVGNAEIFIRRIGDILRRQGRVNIIISGLRVDRQDPFLKAIIDDRDTIIDEESGKTLEQLYPLLVRGIDDALAAQTGDTVVLGPEIIQRLLRYGDPERMKGTRFTDVASVLSLGDEQRRLEMYPPGRNLSEVMGAAL